MKERSGRFILFLAASVLGLPLFFTGHGPFRKDSAVAFLPYTTSGVTVRVEGANQRQGVYTFAKEVDLASVIKMTAGELLSKMPDSPLPDMQLNQGDIAKISFAESKLPEISLKTMRARERMLLGIPLDPDRMDIEDWRCLPGIGPVLAKRIVDYRQKNGDFRSVEAVRRVPGIGEKKFNSVKKHF